jgi:CheY-like chemotaxis protein
MNTQDPPNVMLSDEDRKHQAVEIIDTLFNLLYLVRLDASEPAQVAAYAEQSEKLLLKMHDLLTERASRKEKIAGLIGKVNVLIVDDEPSVTKTLTLVFSNAGYEARSVESAEQALALMKTEGWTPQLAIIDVHLPGMNGIDLAIMLKAQYPEVRMTLFSGRAETTHLLEEARRQGHLLNVLPKPVHPTVFLGMAARLLGNPGQSTEPLN